MTRLVAILACLALVSCGTAPAAKSQAVEPGAEVTLAPGETISVATADMKVRFVAVIEDSRCPRDVNCIWAGEVKVRFGIQSSRDASQVEILEGGSAVAGGYRLTLLRVEPRPASTSKIASQDYRATLKVDKVI